MRRSEEPDARDWAQLEAAIGSLRRRVLVLGAITFMLLGLSIALWVQPPSTTDTIERLRVHELILIDEQGNEQGSRLAVRGGAAQLRLSDGRATLELRVRDGAAGLQIESSGEPAIRVVSAPDGERFELRPHTINATQTRPRGLSLTNRPSGLEITVMTPEEPELVLTLSESGVSVVSARDFERIAGEIVRALLEARSR